jgi:hypothetical protein
MRISLLMIVGAVVAAGCTKLQPDDRLWAAEGVYVEKDFGFVRDHSEPAGMRILEDALRAAEEADPKDIPRIAAIRGRLADLRVAMDFPTEFSRSLLPDDHLFRFKLRTGGLGTSSQLGTRR